MAAKRELLTPAEYARHAKVSKVAVHYAIRDGRLTTVKKNGKVMLDPKVADAEWETNTHHEKRVNGKGKEANRDEDEAAPRNGLPRIGDSRAASEALKAQLLQIDRDKKLGKLIDAEEVKRTAFRLGRQVRDSMLNIPDRVTAVLIAKLGIDVDAAIVHTIMDAEIRKALEGLPNETT